MKVTKIATSINTLINVDRFEHIEFSKYVEAEIEEGEDISKANDEINLIASNFIKSLMEDFPSLISLEDEKSAAIKMMPQKVSKKMPDWLKNNSVPNLAESSNRKVLAKNNNYIEGKEEASADVDKLIGNDVNEGDQSNEKLELDEDEMSLFDKKYTEEATEEATEEVISEIDDLELDKNEELDLEDFLSEDSKSNSDTQEKDTKEKDTKENKKTSTNSDESLDDLFDDFDEDDLFG